MRIPASLIARRAHTLLTIFVCLCMISTVLSEEELEPLNVSIQVAVFWAVPFWIALQEGFFQELGLNVSYSVYGSGKPQIEAAAQDKSWDVGGAGCVPNVLGGLEAQKIQLIAISNDESEISAMAANANGIGTWPPTAQAIEELPISVTEASTVHYAALFCLRKEFPNATGFNFDYKGQTEVIAAMTPDEEGNTVTDYGTLWPPNLYNFLDNVRGSGVVCNGQKAGAIVPGGIMVREEFGNEKPDVVARFVAAWFRGIGYMFNPDNREQAEVYYHEFNEATSPGFKAKQAFVDNDFTLRPFYDINEQLGIFDRSEGKSQVDNWYEAVSAFLKTNDVIQADPPVESYITDKYLKMVKANATLTDFTFKSTSGYILPEGLEEESSSITMVQAVAVGLLVAMNCLALIMF